MRTFAPVCTPPETISKIYGGVFDLPRLLNELEELEQESAQPDFWKNAHISTRVGRRKATIERDIARVADFEQRQADLEATLELIGAEDDADLHAELTQGIETLETHAKHTLSLIHI